VPVAAADEAGGWASAAPKLSLVGRTGAPAGGFCGAARGAGAAASWAGFFACTSSVGRG
jgi:hypothetical protein